MNQKFDDNSAENYSLLKSTLMPSLSLFTSVGTLFCCALPALLVTLGMGATLAGLVSSAPWLTVLSEHKAIVFGLAAVMLVIATIMQWRARSLPCPVDPDKAKACMRLRKISWFILGFAIVVYLTGFFFAFIAVHVFY